MLQLFFSVSLLPFVAQGRPPEAGVMRLACDVMAGPCVCMRRVVDAHPTHVYHMAHGWMGREAAWCCPSFSFCPSFPCGHIYGPPLLIIPFAKVYTYLKLCICMSSLAPRVAAASSLPYSSTHRYWRGSLAWAHTSAGRYSSHRFWPPHGVHACAGSRPGLERMSGLVLTSPCLCTTRYCDELACLDGIWGRCSCGAPIMCLCRDKQ